MADIVRVNGLHSNSENNEPICTLTVPNSLLWKWHQKEQHHAFDTKVLQDLNAHIENGLLAVRSSSHAIAKKLRVAITRIKYKRDSCKGGRSRAELMNQITT